MIFGDERRTALAEHRDTFIAETSRGPAESCMHLFAWSEISNPSSMVNYVCSHLQHQRGMKGIYVTARLVISRPGENHLLSDVSFKHLQVLSL
ncbi:hypothetical protein MPTK1_1g12300 [Marchantia polymorpha subsp. ruderalis]|uniref:Uncharacterized protein n=2 Tax=Marchantia polymorpha TaxID=3197 RepID=A0AAF6APB9_MARPO|nr:hypothetical protein MARPO_1620s0001 [Marchantia polymorpha]BBM98289.1 hypothetical protein Mp_1g12300 [Marchantia polymorpha subsp. ruderalis]|eukprot:PTQ26449.1 hypothetical protein MARPO_1620s0001 [Marchantia polymorpha]